MAARNPFPCGNRAITGTGRRTAPMVNGIRTDMVNERLIWGRPRAERPLRPKLSDPALELAHGELPDHQHARLAVVQTGYGGKVLPAVALEHMRVLDRDLLQRL